MKKIFFLIVFTLNFSLFCSSQQSDSLNPYINQEILKLSNQIYELEKKDSLATATEPNGFGIKSESNISDKTLLVDVNNDSIHYYTGLEVIKLSNYIRELEKRDSLRKIKAMAVVKAPPVAEYHLEEEEEIDNFEKIILFDFNKASLRKDSYEPLEDVLKILKMNLQLHFIIEGYTDITGSVAYNMALSIRRATTVKKYFISKGIPDSRISALKGYGKTKFVATNRTAAGRSKNRRVVIKASH